MTDAPALTADQEATLAYVQTNGGHLYRHDGGVWGVKDLSPLASLRHCFTGSTVAALVKAGRLRYTNWQHIAHLDWKIPIEVSLAPEGAK